MKSLTRRYNRSLYGAAAEIGQKRTPNLFLQPGIELYNIACELTFDTWLNRSWYLKLSERILSPLRLLM